MIALSDLFLLQPVSRIYTCAWAKDKVEQGRKQKTMILLFTLTIQGQYRCEKNEKNRLDADEIP